ncbi:HpaII family restriction endonuclease [Lactovum odontotermitis]
MSFKVNIGEWSELYVFFKVLADGKLYGADENLNKLQNVFYRIIQAIREDKNYKIEENFVIISQGGEQLGKISVQELMVETEIVLENIKNGSGTFEMKGSEPFFRKMLIQNIKAPSTTKGDLTLQIHDQFTGTEPEISFSIKSYIGAKPTLLNTSGETKFTFRIPNFNIEDLEVINAIDSRNKLMDRFQMLENKDYKLVYEHASGNIFEHNLKMLDFRLPEILGKLAMRSYFVKGKAMNAVVDDFCATFFEDKTLIEHKVRDLLTAIALGMVPKTPWTGLDEATGGYIVVKEDGEVLCYHIYDRNRLREYLYTHTKFDSPSTTKYKYGSLYEIDDEVFIDVAVQIRF